MIAVYILITLLMLTLLVTVHEFGHFIMAKKCGVTVLEFSIGMGPALYSKQGEETLFSIRAFPIGGYCRMLGEQEDDESPEADDSAPEPESACPVPDDLKEQQASGSDVADDAVSGIVQNEADPGDFRNKSKAQRFAILAAGPVMNFLLGFVLLLICYFCLGASVSQAFTAGGQAFVAYSTAVFDSLRMLFTGEVGINDLAGPVGMVSMVQEVYSYGFVMLISFSAFLSINLGVMNLLPIPALDGGQMFIIAAEAVCRHDLSEKIKGYLIAASFVFLIGLMVLVAVNDVLRITG